METWEDFGQQVDLTSRIREVLQNYPEGTSILKEFLQNADDASARSCTFCLDETLYPSATLSSPSLAPLQGPALLVHNDAVFSQRDFTSITHIGDSGKRKDEGKTGRFGLGFNSAYHLCDVPSFVSGEHIVFFDPHCRFLNVSPSNPGKKINFVASGLADSHPDQAAPFARLGCDMRREFRGTLFRLPLRTPQFAAAFASKLSQQVYSTADVADLLQALAAEARSMLLFLKHVTRIDVMHIPAASASSSPLEPVLRFSASVGGVTADTLAARALFTTALHAQPFVRLHELSIEERFGPAWPRPRRATAEADAARSAATRRKYVVVQCRGGGAIADFVSQHARQFSTPLVPWGAVAAECTEPPASGDPEEALAFCFLPLPIKTGLPVHVNAFFDISTNRRDLWQGTDMTGLGRLRAAWNEQLLLHAVVPAYLALLRHMAATRGPSAATMSLFPAADGPDIWRTVTRALYDRLCDPAAGAALTWTPHGGGRWCRAADVVFVDSQVAQQPHLRDALVGIGLPLCGMSPPVCAMLMDGLQRAGTPPSIVTPHLLRGRVRALTTPPPLPAAGAAALLDYCLQDIVDDDAESVRQLHGLQLLPTVDGMMHRVAFSAPPSSGASGAADAGAAQAAWRGRQAGNFFSQLMGRVEDALRKREHDPPRPGGPASGGAVAVDVAACEAELRGTLLICEERALELLGGCAADVLLDTRALGVETTFRLTAIARLHATGWRVLDAPALGVLILPRALPAAWRGRAVLETPSWGGSSDVGEAGAPTRGPSRAWLMAALEYAGALGDLRFCQEWPILPVVGGHLHAPLALPVSPLLHAAADAPLPADVVQALSRLGCFCVDASCAELPAPVLGAVAHPATGIGVLTAAAAALRIVPGSFGSAATESVVWHDAARRRIDALTASDRSALCAFLLQERWYQPGAKPALPGPQLALLKALPIYVPASLACEPSAAPAEQGCVRGSGDESGLIPVTPRCELVPSLKISRQSALQHHIAWRSDAERSILVNVLRLRQLSWPQFLRAVLLAAPAGSLPLAAQLDLARHLLLNLSALAAEDSSLVQAARRSAFVVTQSGEARAPQELFDPREPDINVIVADLTRFPAAELLDAPTMAGLAELGMRTQLARHDVLAAARSIAAAADSGADEGALVARGAALWRYLLAHSPQLDPQASAVQTPVDASGRFPAGTGESEAAAFWSELARLAWLPVHKQPPLPQLPGPEETGPLAAPSSTRPEADVWLTSASKRTLSCAGLTPHVARSFGWDRPPDAQTLVRQLIALGNRQRRVADDATRQDVAVAVTQLYKLLAAVLQRPGDLDAARRALQGQHWVWVGLGFESTASVALSGPLDLSPWLFVIPESLSPFSALFLALGVPASFQPSQFASVLAAVAGDTPKGARISDAQMEQVLAAVQQLSAALAADPGLLDALPGLCLPDASGQMVPAAELSYNDASWMAVPPTTSLVHPSIAHAAAKHLGVRSLRSRLLLGSAAGVAITAAAGLAPGVEAFGQSETLCGRIKHILHAYPEGDGPLVELVQNADDAGASRVAVMLDLTNYGTRSVLCPEAAALQGPALLVFNDAVFSPADFHNIARIGQDSKLERPTATGRFGLGFNSVYHLCDVPSFVSGEYIVLFDPHCRFLPGVSAAQPGLKIHFPRADLLGQFPDAFAPFCAFGCNLRDAFSGTLFRLPLRTAAAAAVSKLSSSPCTPQQIRQLMDRMRTQAAQMLLFLKSVNQIDFYERSDGADAPRLLFQARVTDLDGHPCHSQRPIADFLSTLAPPGHDGGSAKARIAEAIRATPDADLPCAMQLVSVRTSFSRDAGRDDIDAAPPAAPMTTVTQTWLLAHALAGGQCKALMAAAPPDCQGVLPWIGIAALVHTSAADAGRPEPRLQGRAFTFLPLPISTGLPVHVNGQFELFSNRRELWRSEQANSAQARWRTAWNQELLGASLPALYAHVLASFPAVLDRLPHHLLPPPLPAEAATEQHLHSDDDDDDDDVGDERLALFWSLFPCAPCHPEWQPLANAAIRAAAQLPVIPAPLGTLPEAGGQHAPPGARRALTALQKCWLQPTGVLFEDALLRASPVLSRALQRAQVPVARGIPAVVQAALAQHLVADRVVSPEALRTRLRSAPAPDIERAFAAKPTAYALLAYLLSDVDASRARLCAAQLAGVRCFPLTDGRLVAADLSDGSPEGGAAGRTPILLVRPLEAELLRGCSLPTVALAECSEPLRQQLLALEGAARLTLSLVRPAVLADVVLPRLLPAHWRGRSRAAWRPESGRHPSEEQLRLLWAVAAESIGDGGGVDALSQWPLWPARAATAVHNDPGGGTDGSPSHAEQAASDRAPASLRCLVAPTRHAACLEPVVWSRALSSAIQQLGCAVSDPDLRASSASLAAMAQALFPPTAAGVLLAINAAPRPPAQSLEDSVHARAATLAVEERDVLRQLLLQPGTFASASAPDAAIWRAVLRCVPLFRCHAPDAADEAFASSPAGFWQLCAPPEGGQQGAPREAFTDLSGPRFLVPPDTDAALLTPEVLSVVDPVERRLLVQHLGVLELDWCSALRVLLAPRTRTVPRDAVERGACQLLARLDEVQAAHPDFLAQLPALEIIPTESGDFAAPNSLVDPTNPELRLLVEASQLPSPAIASDPALLAALRRLGMQENLNPVVLLNSAASLAARSSDDPHALRRAQELLAQLNHLARAAASPEDGPPGARESVSAWAADPDAVADFWRQLQRLSWLPVLQSRPPALEGLPWPDSNSRFSCASRVRPSSQAALCSASLQLLDGQCGPELAQALGWAGPLPMNVLAAQLLALGREHDASAPERPAVASHALFVPRAANAPAASSEPSEEALRSSAGEHAADPEPSAAATEAAAPRQAPAADGGAVPEEDQRVERLVADAATALYQALQDALLLTLDEGSSASDEDEGRWAAESVVTMLSGAPCVWVGSGFVPATQMYVHGPATLAPLLFRAPPELAKRFSPLLTLLGVSAFLEEPQLSEALSRAARHAAGRPLQDDQVAVVVSCAELLAQSVMGRGVGALAQSPLLPDEGGVMRPALQLHFNDAPWLASNDLLLAHPLLPAEVAEGLGCKSLRDHHQVRSKSSEALKCPPASVLRSYLEHHFRDTLLVPPAPSSESHPQASPAQPPERPATPTSPASPGETANVSRAVQIAAAVAAVGSVLEAASRCGCQGARVVLDWRSFEAESVLQPGLAALQGPAVCVLLDRCKLSTEELCMLQLPPHPFRMRDQLCRGVGLAAGYVFADAVQVVSGDRLLVWDPVGRHLAKQSALAAPATLETAQPAGRQFVLSKDLETQFPHQFAPFADHHPGANGTLIRLPLRMREGSVAPAVFPAAWDRESCVDFCQALAGVVRGCVLFMQGLSTLTVSVHDGQRRLVARAERGSVYKAPDHSNAAPGEAPLQQPLVAPDDGQAGPSSRGHNLLSKLVSGISKLGSSDAGALVHHVTLIVTTARSPVALADAHEPRDASVSECTELWTTASSVAAHHERRFLGSARSICSEVATIAVLTSRTRAAPAPPPFSTLFAPLPAVVDPRRAGVDAGMSAVPCLLHATFALRRGSDDAAEIAVADGAADAQHERGRDAVSVAELLASPRAAQDGASGPEEAFNAALVAGAAKLWVEATTAGGTHRARSSPGEAPPGPVGGLVIAGVRPKLVGSLSRDAGRAASRSDEQPPKLHTGALDSLIGAADPGGAAQHGSGTGTRQPRRSTDRDGDASHLLRRLPALPPAVAPLARAFVAEVYRRAARMSIWPLRQGARVELSQGCFLQDDLQAASGGSLGEAGLAYIQKTLPLFDLPWSAAVALRAVCSDAQVRCVTPAEVRGVMRRILSLPDTPLPDALQATELDFYCLSDVASRCTAPPPPAPREADAPPERPPPPQQAAPDPQRLARLGNELIQEMMAMFVDAPARGSPPQQRPPAQPAPDQQPRTGRPPLFEVDDSKAAECVGLPIPVANNTLQAAGVGRAIAFWPPPPCPDPTSVLPSRWHAGFVHARFNAALHARFPGPDAIADVLPLLTALSLAPLTLDRLKPCVAQLTPYVSMAHTPANAVHALLPLAATLEPSLLHKLWELLLSVHASQAALAADASAGGPHVVTLWTPLHDARVLPAQRALSGDVLLPLKWAACVVVPPPAAQDAALAAQAVQHADAHASSSGATPRSPGASAPAARGLVSPPETAEESGLEPAWAALLAACHTAGVPTLHRDFRHLAPVCWPPALDAADAPALSGCADAVTGLCTPSAVLHKLRLAHEVGLASFAELGPPEAAALLAFLAEGSGEWAGAPLLLSPNTNPSSGRPQRLQLDLEFLGNLPLYPTHAGNRVSIVRAQRTGRSLCMCAAGALTALAGRSVDSLAAVLERHGHHLLDWGPPHDPPAPQASLAAQWPPPEQGVARLYAVFGVEAHGPLQLLARSVMQPGVWGEVDADVQTRVLSAIAAEWGDLQRDPPALAPLVAAMAAVAWVEADDGSTRRPNELCDPHHQLPRAVLPKGQGHFPAQRFASRLWQPVLAATGMPEGGSAASFERCARHVDGVAAGLGVWRPSTAASASRAASLQCAAVASDACRAAVEGGAVQHETPEHVAAWHAGLLLTQTLQAHIDTLLTTELATTLRELRFVPVYEGVPSPHLAPRALASLGQCSHHSDWQLAWTQRPVIARECGILPSSASRLGIRSPPVLKVVCAHAVSLGQRGPALISAWPSTALPSLPATTVGLLQHLTREGVNEQQAASLSDAAFLPAGNATVMVSARRLFTRLGGVRLEPFAFEVPPEYAPFMPLLKQLGCRQALEAADSIGLLEEVIGGAPRRLNINQVQAALALLQHCCAAIERDRDSQHLREVARRSRVMVPDIDGRLVHHADCFMADRRSWELLSCLDPAKVTLLHPLCSPAVATVLSIPLLHTCAQQVWVTEPPPELLDALDGISLATCRQQLRSPETVRAVWAVVLRQAPALPELQRQQHTPRSVANALNDLAANLVFASSCHMRLLLRGPRDAAPRDVTLAGAPQPTCRLRCAATHRLVIAPPPPSSSVAAELATAISHALGSPVQLPIVDVLASPERSAGGVVRPALERFESAAVAGQPGMPLPPHDVGLLQLLPLRSYRAGEMVALRAAARLTAPSLAAASAASARATLAGGADAPPGAADKFVLARVVDDCSPPEGAVLYEVFLETAPWSTESVLSSDVFCFGDEARDADAHTPADVSAPSLGVVAPADARSGGQDGADGPPGVPSGADNPAAGPQQGRVSDERTAAAIAQMLSAAGLPVDLERQQLMEQCIALRDARAEAQRRIDALQEEVGRAKAQAEDVKESWSCPVCYSAPVDAVFPSCGHLLCWRCASSCSNRCPSCRTRSVPFKIFK